LCSCVGYLAIGDVVESCPGCIGLRSGKAILVGEVGGRLLESVAVARAVGVRDRTLIGPWVSNLARVGLLRTM
jgi:hypothetical protein